MTIIINVNENNTDKPSQDALEEEISLALAHNIIEPRPVEAVENDIDSNSDFDFSSDEDEDIEEISLNSCSSEEDSEFDADESELKFIEEDLTQNVEPILEHYKKVLTDSTESLKNITKAIVSPLAQFTIDRQYSKKFFSPRDYAKIKFELQHQFDEAVQNKEEELKKISEDLSNSRDGLSSVALHKQELLVRKQEIILSKSHDSIFSFDKRVARVDEQAPNVHRSCIL